MGSPLQLLLNVTAYLAIILLAVKGKRAERFAAIGLAVGQWGTPLVDHLVIGDFRWAVAAISLGLFLLLVRLATVHDRWWLMLAAGAQSLSLATHVVTIFGAQALTWSIVTTRMTVWGEIMILALFGLWECRAAPYAQTKSNPLRPRPRDVRPL